MTPGAIALAAGANSRQAREHHSPTYYQPLSLPKDERFTPPDLLLDLHAKYRFTVDIASSSLAPAAQILTRYITKEQNVFRFQIPKEERVFCNPPYSEIYPWVHFLWRQPCFSFMLLPAWTDRRWWQELVEPFRDRPGSRLHAEHTGRILFGTPEQPIREKDAPKFIGSVYLTFDQV